MYKNATSNVISASDGVVTTTATTLVIAVRVRYDIPYSNTMLVMTCYNMIMPTVASITPLPTISLRKSDDTVIYQPVDVSSPSMVAATLMTGMSLVKTAPSTIIGWQTLYTFTFTSVVPTGIFFFVVRFPNVYMPDIA